MNTATIITAAIFSIIFLIWSHKDIHNNKVDEQADKERFQTFWDYWR